MMLAEPASGRERVASIRIKVVLPAPFGPRIAKIMPARHIQIDAVDRAHITERLDQAACGNGGWRDSGKGGQTPRGRNVVHGVNPAVAK